MGTWYLSSIEIAGGFLAGLRVALPRGLTCIIGPRGSGKSTLAEAVRHALVNQANSRSRADLIQANLGSSVITLTTCLADGKPGYTIRRVPQEQPSLVDPNGVVVNSVDLLRGTFLPLDAYGSAEIEDIAQESLGDKRRLLLDELRSAELGSIRTSLSEKRRDLEANADLIRSANRSLNDLKEKIETLSGARARLASLPAAPESKNTNALTSASKRKSADKVDAEAIAHALNVLRAQTSLASEFSDSARGSLKPKSNSNKLTNSDTLQRVEEILTLAANEVNAGMRGVEASLNRRIEEVLALSTELAKAHAIHEAEYRELQAQDQVTGEAVRLRADAEQAVSDLEIFEKQREETQSRISQLRERRSLIRGQYLLEQERISNVRAEVAAHLGSQAGPKVRLRVLRNADTLGYRSMLLEGLKGARVKNHDDILDRLMQLRPNELSQIIADQDFVEFESHTELGQERGKRILEAFGNNLDPFVLEILALEDRISIELNVSTSGEPNYKDASELSRGQKCTALLPLLLARRDNPLVIDQPEDNLDNHFIYETIVESVRRLKRHRQMLFITHNANIPVLGEADHVIVLDSDGKHGFIRKQGSLDACQDEIVDLLEGGREAFELRRQRYQRSV